MFRLLNQWHYRSSFRYCIQNRLRPTHQSRRKSHKRHFNRFTVNIVHHKTMREAKPAQLISSHFFLAQMRTSLLMQWCTIMMLKSHRWKCITSERKVKKKFDRLSREICITNLSCIFKLQFKQQPSQPCWSLWFVCHSFWSFAALLLREYATIVHHRVALKHWGTATNTCQSRYLFATYNAGPLLFQCLYILFRIAADFERSAIGLGWLSTYNNNKSNAKLWRFRRKFRFGKLWFGRWRR